MSVKIQSLGKFESAYLAILKAANIQPITPVTNETLERFDKVAKEQFGIKVHRIQSYINELEFETEEDVTLFILKYQR